MMNFSDFLSVLLSMVIFCFNLNAASISAKILNAKELEALRKKPNSSLFIYDANLMSTRKYVGIIPGARLLSSSSDFSIEQELPKEKESPLVFYCANSLCTASHSAAKRALNAGYSNVSIMIDGIYGWKKEGLLVSPLTEEQIQNLKKEQNKALGSAPIVSSSDTISIDPKVVWAGMKKQTHVVVDVREKEERHQIIEGSLWYPMSDLQNEQKWIAFKTQLPTSKIISFHCAAGVRSQKAAQTLANDGFQTAYFKGPDQWESEGLPLISGPATKEKK